jgi:hypothetical protein
MWWAYKKLWMNTSDDWPSFAIHHYTALCLIVWDVLREFVCKTFYLIFSFRLSYKHVIRILYNFCFLLELILLKIYLIFSFTRISLPSCNIFHSVPAFKCWCQAVWQYSVDFPSYTPLGGDVMWDQFVLLLLCLPIPPYHIFSMFCLKYICHLVQVISEFCFWPFIESLGSFAGNKGVQNKVFVLFLLTILLLCPFWTFILSYNYTLA